MHTVAHGQGKHRWTARLETESVGLAALTTYDQEGPAEHAQRRDRQDCEGSPLQAVVVRKWNNRAYGPGGQTVLLTHEAVEKPLQVFDASAERSLSATCGSKESQPAWHLQPPPAEDRPRRPGARLFHPGDVCAGHGLPVAARAGSRRGRTGGLATLASSAYPTEPRQSEHLCREHSVILAFPVAAVGTVQTPEPGCRSPGHSAVRPGDPGAPPPTTPRSA